MSPSSRALGARFPALVSALAAQPIFWLGVVITMFTWPIVRSIHAERELPGERPVLGVIRDFTLFDQSGGELGSPELRGRLWVASFAAVDGGASGPSRRVLMTMDEVRRRTRNLGDAIRLVTFSADPDHTTAEQMSALSSTYRASHGTWRFVSGAPARVRQVLADFRVSEGAAPTRVALVDTDQRIRGYYDVAGEAGIAALLRDISLLVSRGG